MAAIGRKTDEWGSRFGFIMAAVGSSVGLGNFWRFPYTAGENGGGAFIIIYLACVLVLGLTVLMAEYALGRKSGRSAIGSFEALSEEQGKSSNWVSIGWIGSFAAFFILTFYVVISAWIVAYIPQAFSGVFGSFSSDVELLNASIGAPVESIKQSVSSIDLAQCSFAQSGVVEQRDYLAGDLSACKFGATISNKAWVGLMLTLFLAANVFIVARGVKGGIERAATILMPAFFVLLLGIVAFGLIAGDAAAAASFLLTPDFSQVSFGTFLAAVGQAFFSIGVGSCLMITYGAYLSRDTDIPSASGIVASADTAVALIAGFAIFPIVFAFGADPAGGPGLFFVSLPIAFGAMGDIGVFVGGAFFVLALFAAFTSSISLMEVAVSWLEERQGVTRPGAAIGVGFVLFMIGMGYVFSGTFIDFVDFVTGNIMLPLCALLVAVFCGWVMSRESLVSEIGEGWVMDAWRYALRWVVPPALTFILIFGTLDSLQNFDLIDLPGFLTGLLGPN
ncbi:MAG: sodium-dependent transporter [Pseudomonadota bacterium]